MSNEERDEAIHPASEIKLARARQQGELCRSYVLAQAIQAGVGLLAIGLAATPLAHALLDLTRELWTQRITAGAFTPSATEVIGRIGWPLALFLSAIFVCGCASHLLQTGWTWGQRPLVNSRFLEPQANLASWFSPSRWISSLTGLICFGLLALWLVSAPDFSLALLGRVWTSSETNPVGAIGKQLLGWLLPVTGVLLVIGGLDYALQRWLYFRRMQMTDQELRDEQNEEQNAARSAMKGRRRG